jgi:hypothetical protein
MDDIKWTALMDHPIMDGINGRHYWTPLMDGIKLTEVLIDSINGWH